ncbi:MAG: outer membrane beta-barrel protein [Pseudomonadales bacterium]|nr:outer membrane beta-barrel protein [Pseudomonadales bacterium]
MKLVKKVLAPVAVSMVAMGVGQAMAYEAGDIVIRGGYASVNPDSTSDDVFPDVLGSNRKVEADDGSALGISLTYMLDANLGIEVLAATPFKHDIQGAGELSGEDIGETKHLPPTVSLQYNVGVSDTVNVYAGIGINYTVFFSEDTSELTDLLGVDTDLELDDSWGLAFSAGVDYKIDDNWGVNAGVYMIDIDSEATLEAEGVGTDKFDVEIDPMVYRLNVVYKL